MMMRKARSKPMDLSHRITPRLLPFEDQAVKTYGKMFVSWIGPTPRVNIMDPEIIREILSNKFGHFAKIRANPLVGLLAKGLVNYDGEKWVKHRRIINPAFHQEKLKMMLPAFYACCSELVEKWEKLVSLEPCEVDVWPYLQNLTADVISRTAFGSSYEEGRRIFELQMEQAKFVIEAARSIYIPGFRFVPTRKNRRMNEIYREVCSLLKVMIEKREKAMKLGEARTDDLLGILMESNYKEIKEGGNAKNLGLSIDEVMEECKLFYFAGQETTSTLLVWTMIVLSMHPEWQVKAREEVHQVFGREKPDFEGLNHLKVVTMILNEVLRLYPPGLMLTRVTYKEMELGNVRLPPQVELAMPILLVHHDRELWGEDAEEFNPERFSEGISKATKNQVSFFPFGWGPRICIGQAFALTEAKMALAMILQNFSFELSPTYTHAPFTIVTLQPQYGAQLILHKL
ncbi:hypothetical protein AQUCO_01600004v1 [Aquilegia coerulea]|uniref:Cytochrome P450 n=1 Tax=Aquilegia coerulea TaxID=218851 RepID=A0A2G5DPR9_AQUCA|nr:hypothetical protein AQUCO_01600004v1 [Aquilegia coerulea]